jgi:hypothetical protein
MLAYSEKIEMKYRQTADILALVKDFEECNLPFSNWNRETYLTIAFWFLYLNPLAEAEQLLNLGLKRYSFENGLDSSQIETIGKPKISSLLRAMNHYITIYKSQKSFAELANLILNQFGEEDFCTKIEILKTYFPPMEVNRAIDFNKMRLR